jgi:hypothetical protein
VLLAAGWKLRCVLLAAGCLRACSAARLLAAGWPRRARLLSPAVLRLLSPADLLSIFC